MNLHPTCRKQLNRIVHIGK